MVTTDFATEFAPGDTPVIPRGHRHQRAHAMIPSDTDILTVRIALADAPPNTPISRLLDCGRADCMRLRTLSGPSSAHSSSLCAHAVLPNVQQGTQVLLVKADSAEPFRQLSAAITDGDLMLLAIGKHARQCLQDFISAESSFQPDEYDSDGYRLSPPKARALIAACVVAPFLAVSVCQDPHPSPLIIELGATDLCDATQQQRIVTAGLGPDEAELVSLAKVGDSYQLEIDTGGPAYSGNFRLLKLLAGTGLGGFQLKSVNPGEPIPTLAAVWDGYGVRLVPFEGAYGMPNWLSASQGAYALTLTPATSPIEPDQIYAPGPSVQVYIAKDQGEEAASSFYHEAFHVLDYARGLRRGHPDPVVNRGTIAREAEAGWYAKMRPWPVLPCVSLDSR
jgi:hypothetical protein